MLTLIVAFWTNADFSLLTQSLKPKKALNLAAPA